MPCTTCLRVEALPDRTVLACYASDKGHALGKLASEVEGDQDWFKTYR